MSWLKKLLETYDNCYNSKELNSKVSKSTLLPICHTTQNAQIEIVIDGIGSFLRARVIPKNESTTIIPCTEDSGGRSGSKPTSHPLCDKLQYIAFDYLKFGGNVTSGFEKEPEQPHQLYIDILSKWCESPYRHLKIEAILSYIRKASVIADLCNEAILPRDTVTGLLLKDWDPTSVKTPEIFKVMANKPPEEAFVRWIVEIPGDKSTKIWEDRSVWESWTNFYLGTKSENKNLCYVTGEILALAKQHPAKLLHPGDKAKLISANDNSGFTFRGRFTDSDQVCGLGLEVTHKAHNALRWLIERQGYCYGTQAVVAWSTSEKQIPDLFADSRFFFEDEDMEKLLEKSLLPSNNVSQGFALSLKRKIAGYQSNLDFTANIVILALDSPTTGRMSITYYRELASSTFLSRIEEWHQQCCWFQNYNTKVKFIGAPSPRDIVEVAYGQNLNDKFRSTLIRQLLTCIIDSAPLPLYFLKNCIRKACNRNILEYWEWKKALSIACALYCKFKINQRKYQMALEVNYRSRDYLYGRLLAIAERLEEIALSIPQEKRATTAERLMQQFAERPYDTWLIIAKALKPYEIRLRTQRTGFLNNMKNLMDEVMNAFSLEEFTSSKKLSGEFLLGYHCQRSALRIKKCEESIEETDEEINDEINE